MKCEPEDERSSPRVGALIVKKGEELVTSYRNQTGHGDHAEFIALERSGLDRRLFIDADLITTLEPCTEKRHGQSKKPCVEWIRLNRIRKVWIGVLDENPHIRGKSIAYLRRNNIAVGWFPDSLYQELVSLNSEFFDFIQRRSKKMDSKDMHSRVSQIGDGIQNAMIPVRKKVMSEMRQMDEGLTTPLLDALTQSLNYLYIMDSLDISEWCNLGNKLLKASQLWAQSSGSRGFDLGSPDLSMAVSCFKIVKSEDPESVCGIVGYARCLTLSDKLPEAERQLIEAKEEVSDDDIFGKQEIANAYFELALFSANTMKPLFLAESLELGGLIVVSFSNQRKRQFIELVNYINSQKYDIEIDGLNESVEKINIALQDIDFKDIENEDEDYD